MVKPIGAKKPFEMSERYTVQKGSSRSLKNQAAALFSHLQSLAESPKGNLAKLDQRIEGLKAEQTGMKQGTKRWQILSEKLEQTVRERSQILTRAKDSPKKDDPFSSLKERLRDLIKSGQQEQAWIVADKLGQGLLQAYGYRTGEQIPAFLGELQRNRKAFDKEELGYIFAHIRSTYPQYKIELSQVERVMRFYG